jgi:hypothetical protein
MQLREDTRIALQRFIAGGHLASIVSLIESDLFNKLRSFQEKEDILKLKSNLDFLSEVQVLLQNEVNDG